MSHSVRVQLASFLLALSVSSGVLAVEYSPGYLWNRSQQWSGGTIPGSSLGNPDDDTLGNPVWTHSISEGGGLGSANPWYSQPYSLLVWDDYWYGNGGLPVWARGYTGPETSPNENKNLNPPISRWALTHDVSEDFGSWGYVPQIRWNNPVGDGAVIDVFTYGGHPLIVEWAGGNGVAPSFDVDFALAKYDASANSYTLLYSTTLSNPAPGSTNPPFPQAFVPLNIRGLRMDSGDELIYSVRVASGGPVGLNWANLYDHPFYIKFVGVVPEPGTYATFLTGLGLFILMTLRKKLGRDGMRAA